MDTNKILLIIAILLCGATGYFAYQTSQEVKELKAQAKVTEQKVYSLMLATVKIAKSTKTVSGNRQSSSFWEALFSEIEESEKAAKAEQRAKAAKAKVTVSTSYRLEDRYVIGKIELPDHLGAQGGTITVNVLVNQGGTVKKTSVAAGATITDPEVIESVRKAALKTDFNTDFDAPELADGTITYTFKKK